MTTIEDFSQEENRSKNDENKRNNEEKMNADETLSDIIMIKEFDHSVCPLTFRTQDSGVTSSPQGCKRPSRNM